jgi:hypothetical protein
MATSEHLFVDIVLYKTFMQSLQELIASADFTSEECEKLIGAFNNSTTKLMDETETHATLETGVLTNHREVDDYHELKLLNVNINVGTRKIRWKQLMIKGKIKSDS